MNKNIPYGLYIKIIAIIVSVLFAGEIACRNKYFNQNDQDLFYFLTPFFKVSQTHKTEHGLFVPQYLAEEYGIQQSDYPAWMNTKYDRPCRDRMTFSECRNEKLPVSFNQFCWRGEELEIEKKAGVFRIMTVGGSALESMNVADEDLFTVLLERCLNAETTAGGTFEVINAGHAAYDSRKINQMLNVKGFVFRPDVVLYMEAFNEQVGALEFFEIQKDMLELGSSPYIGWIHRIFYLRSFLYTYAVEKPFFSFRAENEFKINLATTEKIFRKTVSDCKKSGSRLVYLTQPIDYPLKDQNGGNLTEIQFIESRLEEIRELVDTSADVSSYQNDISALNQRLAQAIQLKVCREMGVPVIDVLNRFLNESNSGFQPFSDMVHRTCRGERALADEIFTQRAAMFGAAQ